MSRYFNRLRAINNHEQYDKVFKDRGIKRIEQYRTPEFFPTEQSILDQIECQTHVWTMGDSLWRISTVYYGDPNHWWVIAAFNRKPTESHILIGEKIKIPNSLAEALQVVQ